jgi:hypothetical protein
MLLQTPCFPAKAFDPVTVDCFGEYAGGNGKTHLNGTRRHTQIHLPVIYLVRKNRKRFSFVKKRLDGLPALQALSLRECMGDRSDDTGF